MKCYCCSELEFAKCCEPYLLGQEIPARAELLMRSRYSAFCLKKMDYILNTTDAQVRFDFDMKGNEEWAKSANFTKLEILKAEENGNKGIVEFKASFTINNEPQTHHEVSTFRKHQGQWFYRAGRVFQ